MEFFEEEGFDVRGVGDAYKAIGRVDGWHPDVVLTDLAMPGMDGLTLLAKLRVKVPTLPVILMTAYGTVDDAVEAHRNGATDFIVKPLQLEQVMVVVRRALQEAELVETTNAARQTLKVSELGASMGMIANSGVMTDVLNQAVLAASGGANVLIRGEEGSGRSTLAKVIHELGARSDRPLVEVSCRGQGPSRLVRALFGTTGTEGGEAGRRGAVERARGGTLVIHELETLPDNLQAHLVSMIETGEFVRGDVSVDADVRVIGICDGAGGGETIPGLRPELGYLVGVISIELPTLREREEDIEALARLFAKQAVSGERRRAAPRLTSRTLATLSRYHWPGNVSQLRQVVERAVIQADGDEITPRHLPEEVLTGVSTGATMPVIPGSSIDEIERWAILQTLAFTGGSTARTAKILGVSPRKVQYRIAEYRDAGLLG